MKKLLLILGFASAFCIAQGQNIPIDFETSGFGSSWNWTVFENDSNPPLEIITNPDQSGINTSATVAKFTALQAGQPFVGCETLHGAGIGTFTIDSSNAIIRIMVWKSVMSDVGIKLVRSDNWSLGEIKISNTVVNQWEQLTFDFSSHMGNTYDQLVIFPDFNARSADNIIYFDNVFGDVVMATSIVSASDFGVKLYPNPAQDVLKVEANTEIDELVVMDVLGKALIQDASVGMATNIDIAHLPNGIYFVKTVCEGKSITSRIVKN